MTSLLRRRSISSFRSMNTLVHPHPLRKGSQSYQGQYLELSPSEDAMVRVSMFLKGCMKVSNTIILDREIDNVALRSAVNQAQATRPILKSKITALNELNDGENSQIVLEVDENLSIPINTHSGVSWKDVWKQVERSPLLLGQPFLRIDLISQLVVDEHSSVEQKSSAASALIVTCEHAFCDGQSLSHLCHDILLNLSTTTVVGFGAHPSKEPVWGPSFESACGANDDTPERLELRTKCMALVRPPTPENMPAGFPSRFPESNARQLVEIDGSTTRRQEIQLSASQFTILLTKCRERKTTVTGALLAALAQASADTVSRPKGIDGRSLSDTLRVAVSCAVDTRRLYAEPIQSSELAYHVSGVPAFTADVSALTTDVAKHEFLWEQAVASRQKIEEALALGTPL